MKSILRHFLMNLVALWATTVILPGLSYTGGVRTLIIGSLGLMFINMAIIPILKIMFLPLNILTLGLFTWAINVIGLYLLTTFVPAFRIVPYNFPGAVLNGFTLQSMEFNILQVAILASFLVGLISHFLQWVSD